MRRKTVSSGHWICKAAIREGKRSFETGILADANRNILYVDEINLLDDHVVDVLLDSAAMGINTVEREGIPTLIRHASPWSAR